MRCCSASWTAFIEVIPYIRPWLSAVPPALYALVVDPVGFLWVAALFVFIYQVEGHIVVPNVMASALRLHPLLVIFGLLMGGALYGIAGVLVALPTMAAGRLRSGSSSASGSISSRGKTQPVGQLPWRSRSSRHGRRSRLARPRGRRGRACLALAASASAGMRRRRRPPRALRAAILGLAVAALLGNPAASGARGFAPEAQAVPTPATFTVRIDAGGQGTFTVRGGLSDREHAAVRRGVAGGRLNASVTLTGSRGRIVLTSRRSCGTGPGHGASSPEPLPTRSSPATARSRGGCVVLDRSGRRRSSSVAWSSCRRPLAPSRHLRRPDGTRSAFHFDVTSDGRTIDKVLLGGFRYDCVRSDGLRTTGSSGVDSTFAGPFPIALPNGRSPSKAGR